VRLDIRRISQIKSGEEAIGSRVRVKVVKNKIAPPFREAEFDVMFNQGINTTGEVLDIAVNHEIVQKGGAWFEYEGTKLGQGREAAKQYLLDNPAVLKKIEDQVRKKVAA
jgi:recombination protein RecA